MLFTRNTCLRQDFGLVTNPDLNKVYLKSYNEPRAKIWIKVSSVCVCFPNQISGPEPSPKKFGRENVKMTSFSSQTLEQSCSETKCYEPITKIAQTLQNKYSTT